MQELLTIYVLPCLWAFVACIGFGLVFNIQGVGLSICGLGGAVGLVVLVVILRAVLKARRRRYRRKGSRPRRPSGGYRGR